VFLFVKKCVKINGFFVSIASETGQGNEEMLRFAPDSPWNLFYDMEAMFPDKKAQAEATQAKEENVSIRIADKYCTILLPVFVFENYCSLGTFICLRSSQTKSIFPWVGCIH
jgi:hypothetical protein